MKTVLLFLVILPGLLPADDITLTDGTVFKNAKVVSHDDIKKTTSIVFSIGVAMVHTEMIIPPGLVTAGANTPPPPSAATSPPPPTPVPVPVSSQLRDAVDKAVVNATGNIIQVKADGLIIDLSAIYSHEVAVPHTEKKTVDTVPEGLGHTPVYETQVRQWTTVETRQDKFDLGAVFLSCPTDDLLAGNDWSGQVWRIGSSTTTGPDGIAHAVPHYTVQADEAYQYFATHPTEVPAPLKVPVSNEPPTDEGVIHTSESWTTPGMSP